MGVLSLEILCHCSLFILILFERLAKLFDSNFRTLSEAERLDLVVQGKVHLKDLKIHTRGIQDDQYSGVIGVFCTIEWHLHKHDPSSCKYVSSLLCLFLYLHLYLSLSALYLTFIITFALTCTYTSVLPLPVHILRI